MKNLTLSHPAFYLFLCVVSLLSACSASKMPTSSYQQMISIENTKWSGVDSDGDFCEYIFHSGGQLEYRTNTSRTDTVGYKDPEDVWSQNGTTIILLKGNTSVQVGELNKDVIEGHAWNKHGRTWTWRVEKHASNK